jgi:molybdopterin-guanine dinucleotide biosynthesis protein A
MDGEFTHPLAAVYRTSVIPQIDELLATDQLKVGTLIECCLTNEVAVEQLRAVDPNLESLINCNRPDDYVRALRKLGFPAPDGFA